MTRVKENKPCPALELMAHNFTAFGEDVTRPCGTVLLAVMWTANSENLTPEKVRFVSVSSDTNLRDEHGKFIFDGGNVNRYKYEGQPEIPQALYELTRSLVTRSSLFDRVKLADDEHATIMTFVTRHDGGYLLSLMGNTRHFNTGGNLKGMYVMRDGRVLYGVPRTDKNKKELLALCKKVYEGGPEEW